MKQFFAFLILIVATPCWSQKGQFIFSYERAKLSTALADFEQKFDVKYSYVDSVVASKTITLSRKKYSLADLHSEVEIQSALSVVKIDERYYSVGFREMDTLQTEVLKEVLVQGFLSKGITKTNGKVVISPQKIEELPGVTDADILLSLQQLPGVKSPNETASGLHVRGGTPDQNLILWDGIRMYHPGHLFGMVSGFNPNVDQTINYYNKATNPKFGEKISSVIDIRQSDEISDATVGTAGINALNADFYLKTPLIKNQLGLQISGRKSFTEYLQSPTFNALAEKVFQNTNFKDFNDSNRFQFQDYSAKLSFNPNPMSEFSITGIAIDNDLDFKSKGDSSSEKIQKMEILNYGLGLNWIQKYSERFSHHLLVYYSAYTFDYQNDKILNLNSFDTFEKHNRITDSGAELNFTYEVGDGIITEFGYQLIGNDISHSYVSKTQDLEILLDQKRLYNITHAGYANLAYTTESWKFQGGVRYNYFNRLKADSFEPRLFVQKRIASQLVWQSSFEKKSQIMSQIRESVTNDLSLENYVWVLSDGANYPIQRANQITTGLVYKTNSWLVDLDAYYKTLKGITSLSFGFMNQFDTDVHNGQGFTKGLDFLVQKSAPNWRAWLTYTFQDSQNKYHGLNDDEQFPISSDIKHAFTASFFKKWKNYSVSLGWFGHTGRPYSELDASNEIMSFNTRRLPFYHRFDFSGAYQFRAQKSWNGKAGISILNLFDRKTVISKEYHRDYATIGDIVQSAYSAQNFYSLGFTTNIFIKVNF